MLGTRPVIAALVVPAATVAPVANAALPARYSTRKLVSSVEASVHNTSTEVEPRDEAVTPVGAAGGPVVPTDATFDGDERPFVECFANTRNS